MGCMSPGLSPFLSFWTSDFPYIIWMAMEKRHFTYRDVKSREVRFMPGLGRYMIHSPLISSTIHGILACWKVVLNSELF